MKRYEIRYKDSYCNSACHNMSAFELFSCFRLPLPFFRLAGALGAMGPSKKAGWGCPQALNPQTQNPQTLNIDICSINIYIYIDVWLLLRPFMHAVSSNATAAAWRLRAVTAAAWPSQRSKPTAAVWCFARSRGQTTATAWCLWLEAKQRHGCGLALCLGAQEAHGCGLVLWSGHNKPMAAWCFVVKRACPRLRPGACLSPSLSHSLAVYICGLQYICVCIHV